MGQLDNPSEQRASESGQSTDARADAKADARADEILRIVTQDLHTLRQDLLADLEQDVRRLRAEKSQLLNDIETLRSQQDVVLSQQQLAQQQAWAKQLAILMANHLHAALSDRLRQMANQPGAVSGVPQISGDSEDRTHRLVAALDDTVNRTFAALRHDLNSYQSSLSQQLDRMQNLGQQGESILQALVGRISQQLQQQLEVARAHPPLPPLPPQTDYAFNPPTAPPPTLPPQGPIAGSDAPTTPRALQGFSSFQLGLTMILLSTLALSLHNVVVWLIGHPTKLVGLLPVGGFITLNSVSSSLLVLWVRMVVVVPLMLLLVRSLYPPTWRDVKQFSQSRDRRLLGSVISSGCFLFLSQVLLYLAISQMGAGVAITVLFLYPLVTVPLSWVLFGDRPTQLRLLVMAVILCGVALTTQFTATANLSAVGISTAVVAGVSFALYLISMQISFRKLHPVPVSLIQFATMFVLSSLGLIVMGIGGAPNDLGGLLGGGLLLGGLTLGGYLLNNLGVRFIGAARASIIAASGPALTALLAFLLTPGEQTALSIVQIIGILFVTMGVITLSFERLLLQNRTTTLSR